MRTVEGMRRLGAASKPGCISRQRKGVIVSESRVSASLDGTHSWTLSGLAETRRKDENPWFAILGNYHTQLRYGRMGASYLGTLFLT